MFFRVIATATLLLFGATALAADKKKTEDEPAKLYEHASKSLKKGYYDDAIAEFEKLRNTYPFHKFAVEAELKIADALFKKREYGDAADAYRTFAKLHPRHEQVDYASFQVGASLFLEAPRAVDRDQASTEKAIEEFRAFVKQFPDSKYAEQAAAKIGEGRDRLAAKEVYVGRYYSKHGKWHAAIGRVANVVDRYPDSPSAVEAQFLLGQAQFKDHKPDAAKKTLSEFVEKHPDSQWTRKARLLLAKMGVTPAPAATATAVATPAATPETTAAPAASPAP